MKKEPVLQRIENDHVLTRKTDPEFLSLMEQSVLLALLEEGFLNQIQYEHARDTLRAEEMGR